MLAPYFEAIAAWEISRYLNSSSWIVPFVQALHLVGMALLAGAILIVDLRLLGKGLTGTPAATVARDARPWLITALVLMVLTGLPQFISLATKEYNSIFWWRKMYFLAAALIFTFLIKPYVIRAIDGRGPTAVSKIAALVSIVLWAMVAINGRLIGVFS